MNRILLSLLAALSLAAQSNTLSGPAPSFVFDAATDSLRPLSGTPGAATLGAPVLRDLDFATAAPRLQHGAACSDGHCFVVSNLLAEPQRAAIAGQIDTPDGAAWSADGSTVLLFSRASGWLRIVRGLPAAADAGSQWSTNSLGGSLAAATMSPDGQRVAVAIAGDHAGVFEVTAAGSFVPVAPGAVSLTFSADSKTLYALDAAGTISEIRNGGVAQSWASGVDAPVAIQADAGSIYVAGRSVAAIHPTTHQAAEQYALEFVPTQLSPLGSGVFLLTGRESAGQILWSYAAGRGVFFVPVAPDAADEAGSLPQRRVRR